MKFGLRKLVMLVCVILIIPFGMLLLSIAQNHTNSDQQSTSQIWSQDAAMPLIELPTVGNDQSYNLNEQYDNLALNSCGIQDESSALQIELNQYEASDSQGFNPLKDQDIHFATLVDDKQVISIDVTENGFSVPMMVLQRGIVAEINFKGLSLDYCNHEIILSLDSVIRELKSGDNIISITPEVDFSFQCWNGMYYGYVSVVNDLGQVDLTQLKDAYNVFQVNMISGTTN